MAYETLADPGSGTKLMQFMAQEENRKSYSAWLSDPMTKAVIRMVEDSIRPVSKPDSMDANRYSGLMDGRYEVLRLITSLDSVYSAVEAAREGTPAETYGVETALRTMFGYTEAEARKILALHAEQKLSEE